MLLHFQRMKLKNIVLKMYFVNHMSNFKPWLLSHLKTVTNLIISRSESSAMGQKLGATFKTVKLVCNLTFNLL